MSWWLTALAIWFGASIPFGLLVGRFMAVGSRNDFPHGSGPTHSIISAAVNSGGGDEPNASPTFRDQ